MSGKSWERCAAVRVSQTAGEVWRDRFPSLALWDSYRRAELTRVTAGNVEVTDAAAGVTYCIDRERDGGGWVIKHLKTAK